MSSGPAFGLLVPGAVAVDDADLAAELHTEFALGPNVRVSIATQQAEETVDDAISRARSALATALSSRRGE